jgi:hypothetical protein
MSIAPAYSRRQSVDQPLLHGHVLNKLQTPKLAACSLHATPLLTLPTRHLVLRWEEDRPGLKELIGALSETRDLMRREIKARTEALASGGASAQAVGAGVTTGFNVIQVWLAWRTIWRTAGSYGYC